MAVDAEEVFSLVQGFIEALEGMTQKERSHPPSAHYVRRYNEVLALAKEAKPGTDERLWPKVVREPQPPAFAEANYAEILTYVKQIEALLEVAPPGIISG